MQLVQEEDGGLNSSRTHLKEKDNPANEPSGSVPEQGGGIGRDKSEGM